MYLLQHVNSEIGQLEISRCSFPQSSSHWFIFFRRDVL